MQFGEGIETKSGRFFGKALLGVGYHYSLPNSSEHVIHDQQYFVFGLSRGKHHHLAQSAAVNSARFYARATVYHVFPGTSRVQKDLSFYRLLYFA